MSWAANSLAFALLVGLGDVGRSELKKPTEAAFDEYIRAADARIDQRLSGAGFLWSDGSAERKRRVRSGDVVIEPVVGKGTSEIPDGLVHDWISAVFIPNTTLQKTLAVLQDVDNQKNIYKAEVRDSKLLSRNGNDLKVFLRVTKKKILTVVLDTYHDVHYTQVNANRWYSRSKTTRISEIENPGRSDERALPPGQDHGFLWRLNSYWWYEERDGGVYVECEAISLTRTVPGPVSWLVNPIVRGLPRESLTNTLKATRDALLP